MIWFGVVIVILLKRGLLSPPVGINVFVVKGIAKVVPMGQIFQGDPPTLPREGRVPPDPDRLPTDGAGPAELDDSVAPWR